MERLRRADPRFPCVVLAEAENPSDRSYRMIDGKHRVHKLVARSRKDNIDISCYVVRREDVVPFVRTFSADKVPEGSRDAEDSARTSIQSWLESHPQFLRSALSSQ